MIKINTWSQYIIVNFNKFSVGDQVKVKNHPDSYFQIVNFIPTKHYSNRILHKIELRCSPYADFSVGTFITVKPNELISLAPKVDRLGSLDKHMDKSWKADLINYVNHKIRPESQTIALLLQGKPVNNPISDKNIMDQINQGLNKYPDIYGSEEKYKNHLKLFRYPGD